MTTKAEASDVLTVSSQVKDLWMRLRTSNDMEADAALYQVLYTVFVDVKLALIEEAAAKGKPFDEGVLADCMHAAAVAAGITQFNVWKAQNFAKPAPVHRIRKFFDAAFRSIALSTKLADPGRPGSPVGTRH